jgi:ferredoxin
LENGFASIYNVSCFNPDEAKKLFGMRNIQYSVGNPGGISTVFCPFLGVRCKVEQRTCQGVKVCKLASPEIINYQHSNVNFEDRIFEKIFQNNELTSQEITLW